MLRIAPPSKSPKKVRDYYMHLLHEGMGDYYTAQEQGHGIWFGKLARRLGLPREVTEEAFTALCNNRHPVTGKQLTPRQQQERRIGWDVSFSAPKSLSVVHFLSGDGRLLEAVEQAALATLHEIEKETRMRERARGKNEHPVTGEMVAGIFRHLTSRPEHEEGKKTDREAIPDPQVHVHAFVMNLTHAGDGKFKALEMGRIKTLASYYQSIFHSRLSERVAELGYKVVQTGKGPAGWEVAGVSRAVIQKFSRRTAHIEKVAKDLGITDPKAKGELGAKTRLKKDCNLSYAELRAEWQSRLTSEEREQILRECRQTETPQPITAKDAVMYAVKHLFQRQSVVSEHDITTTALRHGMGRVRFADVVQTVSKAPFLRYTDKEGNRLVTTKELLAEEQSVIRWVKQGRGACPPLGDSRRDIQPDATGKKLTADQEKAVRQILDSHDRVTWISGVAGSGKTTMLKEVVNGINETGTRVLVLAPSAFASRGVLREAGFKSADTVEMFLTSQKLQEFAKGQVVLIDEASLMGTREMKRLFDTLEKLNARPILSGDPNQHGSPNRGDALPTLQQHAGLQPVQLTEILRQTGKYKQAAKELSQGQTVKAFDRLDKQLKCVHECEGSERFAKLATKYVETLDKGRSVLAVAPTHVEAEDATRHIRLKLQAAGHLDKAEREIPYNRNLQWTEAQKTDTRRYEPGQKLYFHKAVAGMRQGTWLTVTEQKAGVVRVRDGRGKESVLNVERPERFSVYQQEMINVAKGDLLRFTQNVRLESGKRVNAGTTYVVDHFSSVDTALVMKNIDQNGKPTGKPFRVPAQTQLMTHGYVVTSHASQGRTVNTVLICQGARTLRAASQEQAYVSVTRGRQEVHIFTDDKAQIREAIARSAKRESATSLARKAAVQRLYDWQTYLQYQSIQTQLEKVRRHARNLVPLHAMGRNAVNALKPTVSPQQHRTIERGRFYER